MQRKTTTLVIAGLLSLGLGGAAFAQGGNTLPSNATDSSGASGTANTPQNNGVASPGTSGAAGTAGTGTGTSGTGTGTGSR